MFPAICNESTARNTALKCCKEISFAFQAIESPDMLYEEVVEVESRVVPCKDNDLLFENIDVVGDGGE